MDDNTPYIISDIRWTEKDDSTRRRIVVDIPDSLRQPFYDCWKEAVNQYDKKVDKTSKS